MVSIWDTMNTVNLNLNLNHGDPIANLTSWPHMYAWTYYHKRLFLPETLSRKWCCRVHDDIKHLLTPGESTGFKQWATPSISPMPMTIFLKGLFRLHLVLYNTMTTAWIVKSTLEKKNRFEVIMQTLVTLDLHHYEGCHSDLDRAWMISCPDC